MPGRGDPRAEMDVDTDVSLLGQRRAAGVEAHPDPDRSGLQCSSCIDRCIRRAVRRSERDEERVPLGVHLDAAVRRECLAERTPVLGERLRVGLTELVQEAGRALDVREEEGDGAGGKVAHHAS